MSNRNAIGRRPWMSTAVAIEDRGPVRGRAETAGEEERDHELDVSNADRGADEAEGAVISRGGMSLDSLAPLRPARTSSSSSSSAMRKAGADRAGRGDRFPGAARDPGRSRHRRRRRARHRHRHDAALHRDLVDATPASTFRTPFLIRGGARGRLEPDGAAVDGHARAFEMLGLGAPFRPRRRSRRVSSTRSCRRIVWRCV